MGIRYLIACLALFGLCGSAAAVMPASEDRVIQGGLCVGFDCISEEDFSAATMKMRENNLRIRFTDTSAAESGTTSWTLVANDSASGGESYFRLDWLSNQQKPVLSDGTAPDYDCTLSWPGAVVGTIAEGEPVETEFCQPVKAYDSSPHLTVYDGGGAALGQGAVREAGQISLGAAESVRQLKHLSAAVAGTDALVKHQMESLDLLSERRAALAALSVRVDAIEATIDSFYLRLPAGDGDDDRWAGTWPSAMLGLLVLAGWRRRR